ncbi:MAG: hypothetical protein UR28_C0019G0027 [Candidatus Peregrinibacteria bacterium GW2011_GWF2_33_10]|nr:MAG: hypothetical protein UR28_C0019G0027 [Candidatus Peregrinibacteria bacterium GW2011_GWF2_33_10]OGJ43990.1 MAG: hypothetical protein A2272_05150 [Candidatus Peregrinibacteria bacterium RIFOXYA12_FULL_33_12]OGJ45512.1 MAG: hypothetical protein A2263_05935 [Candidatus Peregrinibacteria bacterium RIFOXYA2_FULL_33_21]OGJ50013.1 MAG: hypothetical protein A2307_04565 [Candidatus Peregrinibacteria bacterium RIFOXYB2_FULL_33_20]
MNKKIYEIKEITPSAHSFNKLRGLVGWAIIDKKLVKKGLQNSLYIVSAICDNEVIGFCRLTGDGAMKIHIEEILIHPNHQNKGIGSKLMKKTMKFINKNFKKGCLIRVFANAGLENFYSKFGFKIRKEGMQYKL